jgi:tRNA (Thr-GGU) A37 N-methylase
VDWVVFVFSYARGWRQQLVPPRDTVKRGVLATRAPHRPNPVGITAARLVGVRGVTVTVTEHDLLDGTPVLDLKPYVPYCDAHPSAAAGWTDSVSRERSDHRWK